MRVAFCLLLLVVGCARDDEPKMSPDDTTASSAHSEFDRREENHSAAKVNEERPEVATRGESSSDIESPDDTSLETVVAEKDRDSTNVPDASENSADAEVKTPGTTKGGTDVAAVAPGGKNGAGRGTALAFDGSRSHVVTDLHFDGSHDLTIEAWVRPEDLSRDREIIANAQLAGFVLAFYKKRCSFWVHDGTRYAKAVADDLTDPGSEFHVAAVLHGDQVVLFIDGKRQKTVATMSGKHEPSPMHILIGANPEPQKFPVKCFDGVVDEVHISSKARYTEDFKPAARPKADEFTLALYHFDEGSGTTALDSSTHKAHARIDHAWFVQPEDGAYRLADDAKLPVAAIDASTDYSEWMTDAKFQKLTASKVAHGFHPAEIQGKVLEGAELFRGSFLKKPRTAKFEYSAFHGLTDEESAKQTLLLRKQGFRKLSITKYVNENKESRHCGVYTLQGGTTQFTGKLSFEEAAGALRYEVSVIQGRVFGGRVTDENSDDSTSEVVGGWYYGKNLTLLLQMPGTNSLSPFFTQMKQFRLEDDGLVLQYHLFDYGQQQIPPGAVRHEAFVESRDFTLEEPASPPKETPKKDAATKLIIQSEKSNLCYEFFHKDGRVEHGTAYYRNSGQVRAHIVGGWYDGENLVLAFQFKTAYRSKNTYFSHIHQFVKKGNRFVVEHSLHGFGRRSGGSVGTGHVIANDAKMEKVEEVKSPPAQ